VIQIKRSIFQKGQRLLFVWFAGLFIVTGGTAQEIKLAPKASVSTSLTKAIAKRMSVRQFSNQNIEEEKLSWLLWFLSENNVTGYDSGQVVIQMNDKTYQYDPQDNVLNSFVQPLPDLRMYPSPIKFYLIPSSQKENENESLWIWRGFAGQRIYLGASALGLGTVTVWGIGFPVGYPAKPVQWSEPESLKIEFPDRFKEKLEETFLPEKGDALKPITKESLHILLWSAYGFSNLQEASGRVHRTVPSARGKYTMRVIRISPEGAFEYLPDSSRCQLASSENIIPHIQKSLNQEKFQNISHFLVLIWNRTILKSKEFALYEAGASLANLQLMANVLHHRISWMKVEPPNLLSQILKINEDVEEALMIIGIDGDSPKKSAAKWKDGVYAGASTGWPAMEIEVTIQDGKINNLQILEDNSTSEFVSQVRASLPDDIIQANSIDVDGVSGATLSSNSLKKAIQDALEKAK